MEVSLEGDKLGYFELVTRDLSPGGILTVDLVTSDIIIDREHPEILSEGGLYQFQVFKQSKKKHTLKPQTKASEKMHYSLYICFHFRLSPRK